MTASTHRPVINTLCTLLVLGNLSLAARGAETVVYEGSLALLGQPAEGRFDFRFRLYDSEAADASSQVGEEVQLYGVELREGHFAVVLDFGPDAPREIDGWLEIEVAREYGVGGFDRLEPRQRVSVSSPSAGQQALVGRAAAADPLPAGAVAFFATAVCPPGWSRFAPAEGRAVVGLTDGGTLGGTVGTPLQNLENRLHQHSLNLFGYTSVDGQHQHGWADLIDTGSEVIWATWRASGVQDVTHRWGDGVGSGGSGVYPMTSSFFGRLYTEAAGGHNHLISFDAPTGASQSTLPYVQLLACRKGGA
jgi:hypothetical protein